MAKKKAGGSTKNKKDSAGKRLGVKIFSNTYVYPGNIIVRQRGTKFKPGKYVRMGKDHTIYAIIFGTVSFCKGVVNVNIE